MNIHFTFHPERCVGCRRCGKACRFEAIQWIGDRAAKCNDRLARWQQGQLPLCVSACPRRALTIDEKNHGVSGGLAALREELAEFHRREQTV